MGAEDVDLPVVGRTDPRWVVGGVALVGGIIGYAWWRNHQASKAANAAPVIDAATGSDTGSAAYGNPHAVAGTDPTAADQITTDAQWTAFVENALGTAYEQVFIIDSLGKYLASQGLSADEAKLVRDAWAVAGRPPQHPTLNIVTAGSGAGTPTPTPAPAPTPIPIDRGPGNHTPPPPPPPPPPPTVTHYTIRSGDTLTSIARHYGVTVTALYNANSGTIEAAARAHGKPNANGPDGSRGWWIYPGTILNIPKG